MHRDLGVIDPRQRGPVPLAANGLEGPEIVELVVREVDVDVGGVLARHRTDEDAGAEEELRLDGERVGVRRVDEEQRV